MSHATQPKWSVATNAEEATASTSASPLFFRSTHTTSALRATGNCLSSSCPASRNTRAGASPIAVSSESIAGSDAVAHDDVALGGRLGQREVADKHCHVDGVTGPRLLRPLRGHPAVQRELDVDGVGHGIGV